MGKIKESTPHDDESTSFPPISTPGFKEFINFAVIYTM